MENWSRDTLKGLCSSRPGTEISSIKFFRSSWGSSSVIATGPGAQFQHQGKRLKSGHQTFTWMLQKIEFVVLQCSQFCFLRQLDMTILSHLISIMSNQSLSCHAYLEFHVWLGLGTTKSLCSFWILGKLNFQSCAPSSRSQEKPSSSDSKYLPSNVLRNSRK